MKHHAWTRNGERFNRADDGMPGVFTDVIGNGTVNVDVHGDGLEFAPFVVQTGSVRYGDCTLELKADRQETYSSRTATPIGASKFYVSRYNGTEWVSVPHGEAVYSVKPDEPEKGRCTIELAFTGSGLKNGVDLTVTIVVGGDDLQRYAFDLRPSVEGKYRIEWAIETPDPRDKADVSVVSVASAADTSKMVDVGRRVGGWIFKWDEAEAKDRSFSVDETATQKTAATLFIGPYDLQASQPVRVSPDVLGPVNSGWGGTLDGSALTLGSIKAGHFFSSDPMYGYLNLFIDRFDISSLPNGIRVLGGSWRACRKAYTGLLYGLALFRYGKYSHSQGDPSAATTSLENDLYAGMSARFVDSVTIPGSNNAYTSSQTFNSTGLSDLNYCVTAHEDYFNVCGMEYPTADWGYPTNYVQFYGYTETNKPQLTVEWKYLDTVLSLDAAEFVLDAKDVSMTATRRLDIAAAEFALTANDVAITAVRRISLEAAQFYMSTGAVALVVKRININEDGPMATQEYLETSNDSLGGLVNGANVLFTLSREPDAGSVIAIVNNTVVGFARSGMEITLGVAPQVGDTVVVRYTTNATPVPVGPATDYTIGVGFLPTIS